MSHHHAVESLPSAPTDALASVRYRLAIARTPPGHLATVARDADEIARVLAADKPTTSKMPWPGREMTRYDLNLRTGEGPVPSLI
jgi:hypothetical protein